jgi:hypothetical protein
VSKLLSAVRLICYGVALGLVAFATYILVAKLVLAHEAQYRQGLVGAFMGALFAFLFVRLGETLTRLNRRRVEHYNGLVHLEYSLNEIMDICGQNLFRVNEAIRRCRDWASMPAIPELIPLSFRNVPVDKGVLLSLTNIDLVNEVFGLGVELQRVNDTLGTLENAMARVATWLAEGKLAQPPYSNARDALRKGLVEFRQFLDAASDRAIGVLALVRLLQRDKPFLVRLTRVLTKSRFSKKQLAMKGQEVAKIREEIQLVQRHHEERLKAAGARIPETGPDSR